MLRMTLIFFVMALALAMSFAIWGDDLEARFSLQGAVAWLRDYGDFAWIAAIGLLVADLALPVPATVVMAALGMVYGPVLGGIFAVIGALAAGFTGYGLCRVAGRPAARRLIGDRHLDAGDRLFANRGGWIVALSRWVPIVAEVAVCMAGLTAMPLGRFSLALISGSLPLGVVYAVIGYAGIDRPLLALGLCIALPAIMWLVLRSFIGGARPTASPREDGG